MIQILEFFFSPARPFSLFVNVVILAILAYALVQLVRDGFLNLKREGKALEKLRRGVKPEHRAEDVHRLEPQLPAGIVQQRVKDLWQLKSEGDDINQDTMSAIARSELESYAPFARWAAPTVVLVGLAGTLIGLAQAVQSSDEMLSGLGAGTWQDAAQNITNTFSGIQVAFSTTLSGIIAATILTFLIAMMRRDQERFLRQLEAFTLTFLIPRFRTSASLALAQSARSLGKLEKQLDSTLREVQVQLKSSLESVIDEMRTRGQALTSTVDKSFEQLTDELRERSEALLSKFDESHDTLQRLIGSAGDDVRPLVDNVRSLQEGVSGIREATETARQLVPELEESIARQVDQQTKDINEAINSYTHRLAEGIERQDEIIKEGMDSVDGTVDRLAEMIPELGAEIRSATDGNGKRLEGIQERLHTMDISLSHLELLQELRSALTYANEHLRELNGAGSQSRDALQNHGQVLASVLGEVQDGNRQLQEILDALRNGGDPVGTDKAQPLTPPDLTPGVARTTSPQTQQGKGTKGGTQQPKNLFQRWFGSKD